MKKIRFFPAPHIEMVLHVSEQMKKDLVECHMKALRKGKNCDQCSWHSVSPYGIDVCGIKEVVDKILT